MLSLWQGLVTQPVGLVLLSHDDLRNRRRYLNARATLRELLRIGALPIVNENDTVAVDELKVGDNDNLAAVVATLVEADALLIATDTEGLYTGHPAHDPDAKPVPRISEITSQIMQMAAGGAGALGTGGMYTKLEAASKAACAGIDTVLFCGHHHDTVSGLARDRLRGTFIPSHGHRLGARKMWLRHTPPSGGVVRVDEGAAEALATRGASLLPGGVVGVEGAFNRDAMVDVMPARGRRRLARGLVQYQSSDLQRIAGHHSREIADVLGFNNGTSVIRREDLVLLGPVGMAAPLL
jgi:glutamate 5-kinase